MPVCHPRAAGGSAVQAGKCDNKGRALEDWADVLKRDERVVYNKPDVLNPFFVVYGAREPAAADAAADAAGAAAR